MYATRDKKSGMVVGRIAVGDRVQQVEGDSMKSDTDVFDEYVAKLVPDGVLIIDTMYRFRGDAPCLYAFLHVAEKMNCRVVFLNEDFEVSPAAPPLELAKLSVYQLLWDAPEIADAMLRAREMLKEEE